MTKNDLIANLLYAMNIRDKHDKGVRWTDDDAFTRFWDKSMREAEDALSIDAQVGVKEPDLQAEDELAELEVLREVMLKPFYEQYDVTLKRVLEGRELGDIFQASNGLVMQIRATDGQYTYNKPFTVARSKVSPDDKNTLAAKTMAEAGFTPRVPVTNEDLEETDISDPEWPVNKFGAGDVAKLNHGQGIVQEHYARKAGEDNKA